MPVNIFTTIDDPLPPRNTRAFGINNSGLIVGSFVDASNHQHGFLLSGGSFITLAATLAVVPAIPVTGLALILGVDRFLAEIRTATNFIGNGVAAVVISRWEGELDAGKLALELSGRKPAIDIPRSREGTERVG